MATYSLPQASRARARSDGAEDLMTSLSGALAAAEARGAETLRQRILVALGEGDLAQPPPNVGTSHRRSERVETLVRAILGASSHGLLTQEVKGRVMARDGRIQENTIRAELQAGDGVLYYQERGRWHLIEEPAGREGKTTAPPTQEV